MENVPKVSVIIPVYNMEKYLRECLDSVLDQTLTDIEVITVNDGSTDSSPKILQSYMEKDDRVIVINQTNSGVAAARNRAMEQSQGEFICFIDPDDFYPNSETLNLLYFKAKEKNASICGGSFSEYRDGVIKETFLAENEKYTFKEEGFVNFRDYQFDYGYHRFLYSRKLLVENHIIFPPYKRFQDPPFMVNAMIAAKEFYAVPNVVYRYRVGHQASPGEWPVAKLRDMLRGYLEIMTLSKVEQLEELHARIVWRVERDYVSKPVMKVLRQKDEEMLMLLMQINNSVDAGLLQQAGVQVREKDYYVIREMRGLLEAYSVYTEKVGKSVLPSKGTDAILYPKHTEIEQLQAEIRAVKNSWTFRIGRVVTFIPRKIRGGIHCYQEHGLKYTLRRIAQKLHLQ